MLLLRMNWLGMDWWSRIPSWAILGDPHVFRWEGDAFRVVQGSSGTKSEPRCRHWVSGKYKKLISEDCSRQDPAAWKSCVSSLENCLLIVLALLMISNFRFGLVFGFVCVFVCFRVYFLHFYTFWILTPCLKLSFYRFILVLWPIWPYW